MLLLSLLLWLSCGASPASATSTGGLMSADAPDRSQIIATVDGQPITADMLWRASGRSTDPARVVSWAEKLVFLRELAYPLAIPGEAARRGYRQDPRLAALLREALFALHVTRGISELAFSEEQLQRAYEAHKGELVMAPCVDLQRVLIRVGALRTEAEALAEIEEIATMILQDPADLERIAFERSDDLHSDYRCQRPGGPDTAFALESALVARALDQPLGELSEAIRTSRGYNLVVVTDRRGGEVPTFNAARADLRRLLIAEATADARARYLAGLRAQAGTGAALSDEDLLDRAVAALDVDEDWRIQSWMVDLMIDDELGPFDRPDSFTEAELRAWLAADPARYRRPEELRVATLTVTVGPKRTEAAARAEATAIWRQLRADPARFDELARAHSDERWPSSGRTLSGGALLVWTRDEPALAARLAALSSGEFTEPVRGAQGYTIVRLLARRPAREGAFELDEAMLRLDLSRARSAARRAAFQAEVLEHADLVIDEAALDALALNQRPPQPSESPFQGLPNTLH